VQQLKITLDIILIPEHICTYNLWKQFGLLLLDCTRHNGRRNAI